MIGRLSHNFVLKMLALGLSLGLWLIVTAQRREQLSEQAFRLPLIFTAMPESLIVTSSTEELPEAVNVRLRGPESRLEAFFARNRSVQLDLSDAQPGEFDEPVTANDIEVPNGVRIISIDPPRVTLNIERRQERQVPVRPFLAGDLPNGFLLGDTTVNPDRVRISGPESVVADISETATERIILSGRRTSFSQRVGLVVDHPQVQVVEPNNVVVTVVVVPVEQPPVSGPPTQLQQQQEAAAADQ